MQTGDQGIEQKPQNGIEKYSSKQLHGVHPHGGMKHREAEALLVAC
jgi:hypothetical protein